MSDARRHLKWLYEQLPEWQSKGWIDENAADCIRDHYGPAPVTDTRKLTSLLLSLAATLLIGGGVILILAHNWDELSRPVRAGISILPLLVTLALGWFTLTRKKDSAAWRESSAVANICALMASISLVAQTYNISGDIGRFLLTVSILSLPAIYLFRSTGAALLYLLLITIRRWTGTGPSGDAALYIAYWATLALLIPFLIQAIREKIRTTTSLSFLFFLSIAFALPTGGIGIWGVIGAYTLLFATIAALATIDKEGIAIAPNISALAHLGIFFFLMMTSFSDLWEEKDFYDFGKGAATLALLAVLAAASVILIALAWRKTNAVRRYWMAAPLVIIFLRLLTIEYPAIQPATAALLINALAIGAGVITFIDGYKKGRMTSINAGMLVIAILFICRFFDADLPILARGIAFIVIGSVFLAINRKLGRKFHKEIAR